MFSISTNFKIDRTCSGLIRKTLFEVHSAIAKPVVNVLLDVRVTFTTRSKPQKERGPPNERERTDSFKFVVLTFTVGNDGLVRI